MISSPLTKIHHVMRRILIPLTSTLLAVTALAQAPAGTDPDSPAAKAVKAMEAMDALTEEAPAAPAPPGEKSSRPIKSGAGEAGKDPALPLLPAAGGASQGMDLMSRAKLDMLMPSGRSHRGVHYPMYRPMERAPENPAVALSASTVAVVGVTPPLESLFESDIVTRLDDDHVQFDRARWVQYEAKPEGDATLTPSMTLEMERGVYDLKSQILMTSQPVKIENQQFVITGDTMLHDRASGLTRLTGRVKMTFFNEEPETAAPKIKPAPAPSAAPAVSPATRTSTPAVTPKPLPAPTAKPKKS